MQLKFKSRKELIGFLLNIGIPIYGPLKHRNEINKFFGSARVLQNFRIYDSIAREKKLARQVSSLNHVVKSMVFSNSDTKSIRHICKQESYFPYNKF